MKMIFNWIGGICIGLVGTTLCIAFLAVVFAFVSDHRSHKGQTVHIHIISLDDLESECEPEPDGREDIRLSRYYTDLYLNVLDHGERLAKKLSEQ